MSEQQSMKVKICLIGDSAVGKTSLIRRYVMDIFDDRYISTLGTKVSRKDLKIKRNELNIDLMLSIWDVLGQEEFSMIQSSAFKGSSGALLVCDLTRPETLNAIYGWSKRIIQDAGNIPMILLANKSDLTDKCKCTEAQLQKISQQLNINYFLTSAKSGDNVIRAFYSLGRLIIEDIFKKK